MDGLSQYLNTLMMSWRRCIDMTLYLEVKIRFITLLVDPCVVEACLAIISIIGICAFHKLCLGFESLRQTDRATFY